jgi:hypothetical protein
MERLNLYEATVEGQELNRILTEMDGEITPELEKRYDTFMRSGRAAIEAAVFVVRGLEASEVVCRLEAKRLECRGDSYEKQSASLKARILGAIDAGFDGSLKTSLFTVYGQTSAATRGFEISPDADLASIQKAYPDLVRTKYELDNIALKNRIQSGDVPPAITVISNPGKRSLRIR